MISTILAVKNRCIRVSYASYKVGMFIPAIEVPILRVCSIATAAIFISTRMTTTLIPLALLPTSYWANYTGRCPSAAVNCYHILHPWEIVSLVAPILGITFHCLVFHFLLRHALRGHPHFSSPFYKLYLVLAATEIITSVETLLVGRPGSYGFFLDIYEGNDALAHFDYVLNDYFTYFQWFTHALMAANRFTVFAMPTSYKKIWNAKTIAVATAILSILPFPFFFYELTAAAEYYYFGRDQLIDYYTDETVMFDTALIMACTSLFTSLLSATLEIAGLIAFKRYAQTCQISEENRKNLRLLFCSLLMLLPQSIMTVDLSLAVYGTVYDAPDILNLATSNGPWVWDQFRCLSPICLVITSKDFRREFLRFYRLRKSEDVTSVEPTTSLSIRTSGARHRLTL